MPDVSTSVERSRIQLCGHLSVEIDGVMLAGALRGRQVPLLLAYLALHRGRPVGREELIGALWPGNPPRSQDAALRTLLSRLRSALGAATVVGREELALQLPEPVWIDYEAAALEIERASRELDAGEYRNAWALAQVPLNISRRGLLPGVTADWLEPGRRELAEIQLRALELIGRAGLRLGGRQLASVQRAARGLIDAEPYRESGYGLLIEALAAEGNVAEGLRVFDRLRRLLVTELGTAPSPQMLELHGRLLAPERATPPALAASAGDAIALPAELAVAAARPFVGRAAELAELRARWEAEDGQGALPRRLALVRGDAGVGKTRLIAQLAAAAHAGGAIVLAGRTPQETLTPYQPFVEALRQYVLGAELETLRRQTRESGRELAPLAPELQRRLPELAHRGEREGVGERYRLFEAFIATLTEIARHTPLLLVLDDLHWADRTTLLLLRHVARAPALRRVLILGSYRSAEAPSPAFTEALGELRRDRLVAELELRGLSEPEVADLVLARTQATPSPPLLHALWRRTEGNPFYVEELVRHLAEAGVDLAGAGAGALQRVALPPQVKDVIGRRLGHQREATLELLRGAAVLGRDIDASLLEHVLTLDEDAFLQALEATIDAGLLAETPGRPGRYGFTHALIRETLYDGMSAPRRVRIHRRVAEAIEAGREDDPGRLPALALHYTRAAEPETAEKAIAYAVAAAEQAVAALAHEEAAEHYAGALAVQQRLRAGDSRGRSGLLLRLGEALARAGDRGGAWEAFREAAEIAAEEHDTETVVAAAIGASYRYVHQPAVFDAGLVGLLDTALAATAGDYTAERVSLLARQCGAVYFTSQRHRMEGLSAEATAIARRLGDPVARAHAAAAYRRAHWRAAELEVRIAAAAGMLRDARAAGALELELQAHAWLAVDLLEQGDGDAVEAQIEAFAIGAERMREPRYLWTTEMWRAMRAHLAGELAAAEGDAVKAYATGRGAEPILARHYHVAQLLSIRLEQLRGGELLADVDRVIAEVQQVPAWRAARARLQVQAGELEAAAATLDALDAEGLEALPDDGNRLITLALLSEVCHGLGDAERAAVVYELLVPYAERTAQVALAVICWGPCHRDLGLLAAAAGDREAAIRHLELAIDRCRVQGALLWGLHARLDLAELVGPGAHRERLLAACREACETLELPLIAQRTASLG